MAWLQRRLAPLERQSRLTLLLLQLFQSDVVDQNESDADTAIATFSLT